MGTARTSPRTSDKGLSTGELARQAGVNIETLRFYERKGLLAKPPRSAANYRLYSPDAVRRVRFVKRAQELGFSLKEIAELLSLRAKPKARCTDVYKRAEDKIGDIDEKVRTLRAMRKALSKLMSECTASGPVTDCPILDAFDSKA